MVKVLKKPGELSDWIELSDAIHHYLDPPQREKEEVSKLAEEDAAKLKLATSLADDMAGCAVRVKMLSELDWAGLDELNLVAVREQKKAKEAEEAKETADQVDELAVAELASAGLRKRIEADMEAMRRGLGEVRGFGFDDDSQVEVGEDLFQALAASGYRWLIAQIVRSYQLVEPADRPGFFSPALGSSPSATAPTAASSEESASTAA